MAFVKDFTHDVFISYAQIDNQPLSGAEQGWVTTLKSNLERLLAIRLGSREVSLWTDHNLAGNAPLTPEILGKLRETATLLVVLSRGYLNSEWCRREREAFLRERSGADSRLFVVELDRIEQNERPPELCDLLGYRFWMLDAESKEPFTLGLPRSVPEEYHKRLDDLSRGLASELQRIADLSRGLAPAAQPDAGPAVFLAEATDDLDPKREDVRRYLIQAGLSVLPETWYPRDPAQFQAALDRDLARCETFAQLLSEYPGKKPQDLPRGYVGLQYDRAVATGKRILQWRSSELKTEGVADPDHRSLLEGPSVRAEGIEEFKGAVVRDATRTPPPPPPVAGAFVFVSSDPIDRSRAEELANRHLKRRGLGYVIHPTAGDPGSVRQYLEVGLKHCDAALVIYCDTHPTSLMAQVAQCNKIISQRDRPHPVVAVYDGPPPKESELDFWFPNLHCLDCRQDEAALEEFLKKLGAGRV